MKKSVKANQQPIIKAPKQRSGGQGGKSTLGSKMPKGSGSGVAGTPGIVGSPRSISLPGAKGSSALKLGVVRPIQLDASDVKRVGK